MNAFEREYDLVVDDLHSFSYKDNFIRTMTLRFSKKLRFIFEKKTFLE